jgi:hypothetical protein
LRTILEHLRDKMGDNFGNKLLYIFWK